MTTMTDLQTAKENLSSHTICLCKDGNCTFSDKKGIAPIIDLIESGADLQGYSVADLIVGKAAAMLYARCKIVNVFAKTLSKSGKDILEKYGIYYEYETLTERIINRQGTDICPMEKAVLDTNDLDEAFLLLQKQQKLFAAARRAKEQ